MKWHRKYLDNQIHYYPHGEGHKLSDRCSCGMVVYALENYRIFYHQNRSGKHRGSENA